MTMNAIIGYTPAHTATADRENAVHSIADVQTTTVTDAETGTQATVSDHRGAFEAAAGELVNRAMENLAKRPTYLKSGDEDRDGELRPLAQAVADMALASHVEIFKVFGKAVQANDADEDTVGIFRRILGKVMTSATKDLHFRARLIEKQQEKLRRKGVEIKIGELETYDYPGYEKDPHKVSDYYAAVEAIKGDVDAWNLILIDLLGWNDSDDEDVSERFAIPYMHAPVPTEENLKKSPAEREYEPVHELSKALHALDRDADRKVEGRRKAAKNMLAAMLA